MATFEDAAEAARSLTGLSNQQKLELYSLFKQATVGDCDTKRPGFFDMTGKAKWDAWNEKKGVDKAEAEERYIDFVASLSSTSDERPKEKESWGPVFSSFAPEETTEEGDKDIFYFITDGDEQSLRSLLSSRPAEVEKADEDGMRPLHYAADRDRAGMASLLLEKGADVNAQDEDGQTALHIACENGSNSVVDVLMRAKADTELKDGNGKKAFDLASSSLLDRFSRVNM
eukprot:CAMPEP_0113917388 /NCGR_PEP_ID=MMETSP0780_2-20120614/32708_1 /TAXON_ID=652834 /ORGANISM="Palpitomonas bilix" /LENGTH=228 /DNA_ID=CAMNT_0000916959 /DNA_START=217 /DNA_END=903 /DNA_ORIENTATION=+ /assembly_acc=CAM_ASM_000599